MIIGRTGGRILHHLFLIAIGLALVLVKNILAIWGIYCSGLRKKQLQ